MKKITIISCIIFLLWQGEQGAYAQTIYQTTGVTKYYNQTSTWDTGTLPGTSTGSGNEIIVKSGDTLILNTNPTYVYRCMVEAGATLDLNGCDLRVYSLYNSHFQANILTVDGTIEGSGTVYMDYVNSSDHIFSGVGLLDNSGGISLDCITYGYTIPSGSNLTVTNGIGLNKVSSGSGSYILSGTLTVSNGNIELGNPSNSNGKCKLTINSTGRLIMNNGDLVIIRYSGLGTYQTASANATVLNSGYVYINGNLLLSNAIYPYIANHNYVTFDNKANSTLQVNGSVFPRSPLYPTKIHGRLNANASGNTVIYGGAVDQDVAITGTFNNITSENVYWNLTLQGGGIKSILKDTSTRLDLKVLGNLTIAGNAQADVENAFFPSASDVYIKGNWINTGIHADPFLQRTKKVIFNGSALQTITAGSVPGGESFYNLVINNSDTGVVLTGSNITVTDTLTLNDGLLHTGTDTVWVSSDSATAIQSHSDTSYVKGYLKRGISPSGGSYDFPIGNATAYALANVDFVGSDTIGTLTVDFSNPASSAGLPLTDANDAVYDNLLNCGGASAGSGNANAGVWNIHPGKGSAIYDLSLYGRHFDTPGTIYHSIVKRNSNLVPWEFAGTYLPAELTTDTLIARRTCLTDFYQFAIAKSNTSGPLNTAPVSFLSHDSMICGSKCIAFTGKNNFSATKWRWTLSGGTFSNLNDTLLQNPSNICFNDLGNYDVRLIASTACHADTLERTEYVRVNYLPTAVITAPDSVCSGVTANLSASPTGIDLTYLWSTTATTATTSTSPTTNTSYSVVVSTAFCSDTAYTTIAVTTTPTASINANTTAICSGKSTLLSSTGTAGKYLWSSGESSNAITVSPATIQSYSLTLSNGNCSDQSVITINVTTTPTAIISGETSICSGKRIVLSEKSSIPGLTFLWSTGTTNQSINAIPLTNTTYSVVLTNGICRDSANISITVTTSPTLTLTSNKTIVCSSESVALSATGAGDYLWSTGESGTSITVNPLLPIRYSLFTIHYSLKLSNGSCSDTDSILITVVPTPTASISGPVTICSGNSTGLSVNPGDAYLWSTGEITADIAITPSINTAYSVTISNGNGLCTDTASRSITLITPVPANAGPDITMAIGLDTILSANDGSAWSWTPKVRMDCSTCQNPIVAPFQTTNYIVTVTDINGCISSDSVKVYVIPCAELFIPKVFSPNNDGQNDVLYIRGTDCIDKINAFTIFNRWGEKVFETFDIKAGWDGSQTKETLPNEVFIYYLDALSINGDAVSKTGNVTLMK